MQTIKAVSRRQPTRAFILMTMWFQTALVPLSPFFTSQAAFPLFIKMRGSMFSGHTRKPMNTL